MFPLGRTLATPAALERAEEHGINLAELMARHHAGDWGDVDGHDWRANDEALRYGSRLMSVYGEGDRKLYVITEADRAATTILLPSDY